MDAGEGNVLITLPTNNSTINISGWTCQMVVGLAPNGQPKYYTATPNAQGTAATYLTSGNEFPVAGTYYVELHATAPGATAPNKSRTTIQVGAAFP